MLRMFRRKTKQTNAANEAERLMEIAQKIEATADKLQESFNEAMVDSVVDSVRLSQLQWLCGNTSIEDRVFAATNYEFGLRVMKKQLEDQLIYISDGDKSAVSTVQFNSVGDVCKIMLCTIDALLQSNTSA